MYFISLTRCRSYNVTRNVATAFSYACMRSSSKTVMMMMMMICEVGIIDCHLLENIEMLRKLTILQQKNVRFGVHQIHTYSLLVFAKIVPFAFYPGSSCVILYSEALVACKCVMCLTNKQLFGPPLHELIVAHAKVITCPAKWWTKFLTQSQTSTATLLKFGNG